MKTNTKMFKLDSQQMDKIIKKIGQTNYCQ